MRFYLHVTGHEIVAVEVLRQIQCIVQLMTVLQLHDRLPFVQPSGFALALFRPHISEVDSVADELCGRIILGEDISQLRQAAVYIHSDALGQRLRFQRIQSKEQFIRVGRVHIFAGIRKPDPDALHIVAACQLDPDAP